MKKENPFDFIFDTQEVYRKLLDALSNPGRNVEISGPIERMAKPGPAFCCLAATLLDSNVHFAVPTDKSLESIIHEMTFAHVASAKEADFIFLPAKADTFDLTQVKTGTMDAPHLSATIAAAIPAAPSRKAVLSGPGIDGDQIISLPLAAFALISKRDAENWDYPTGVDLIFCTDNNKLFAIPRKITVKEVH